MALEFLNDAYFAAKVGIGTDSPKQQLHVSGGTTAGDVTKMVIGATGGNAESYLYLAELFSGDNVNYGFAFVADGNSSNNLLFKRHSNSTSGTTVMEIRRDSDQIRFNGYSGTNQTGTPTYILGTTNGGDIVKVLGADIPGVPAGSGVVNYLARWTPDANTLATGVAYDNGTNVGILTTNPLDRLQVSGVISATANDTAYSNGYFAKLSSDYGPNALKLTSRTGDILRATDYGSTVSILTGNPTSVKMFINSAGNVGIGTTSPNDKLDVTDGNSKMVFGGASSDRPLLYFQHNAVPVDGEEVGLLDFRGYNDASQDTRYVILTAKAEDVTDGSEDGSLTFQTMKAGTATTTLNLRSGNVGIGTNSPGYKLDVSGTGQITSRIISTDNSGARFDLHSSGGGRYSQQALANGDFFMYDETSGHPIQRYFDGASGAWAWYTVGTERMRIGSNGNIAIGTTATTYRLQVEQDNNGNLLSRFHNTAANGQGLLIRAGGVSSANRILQLASENDTKVMTVNSNGRVGIGTANPTEKLEVVGNIKITAALLSNQENTDVDTGTETVANVAIATYTAAFFDFVIKKTTNVRSGTVYACHDGTSVAFTETSTQDLGDTSDVTLSVDISGTNMRLRATTTSDDWSVKSLIRAI